MAIAKAQLWGRYLGLALVSGGVLALQVTFTRIFSIMIWHHFTYLVIGVALLGGGVAGTFLAVRQKTAASLQQHLSWLALGFSLCILVNLLVISNVGIDPLRMRQLPQTLLGLAIYFSSLFATFFMGGLTIAAIFSRWVEQSHRLYFADMLGASISTLAVIGLIQLFGGPGTIALIACLVGCAGLFLNDGTTGRGRWLAPGLVAAQLLIFMGVLVFNPIKLPVPESKELGWAMRAQQAEPEYTRWNPVGRVDVMPEMVVQEPKIVGAVSSVYFEQRQSSPDFPLKLVTIDGTSMTGLYQFDGSDADLQRFNFLENAVISAPYHIGKQQPSTLLIGVGGGLDILLARLYDARQITAIELNADIVQLLRGPYASYTGNIASHPTTELHVAEGRSFLMQTNDRYDIIQGIGLDNLAALSGGAYVLAESYIYTVDSLEQSLNRLTPDGVFSWTRDVNEPPREMLRLTGLAAEALRRQGVREPQRHIAIVANESGQNATLLVRRSPFTPEAMQQLRTWAEGNRFTVLQDPFVRLNTAFADYL
nr:hypothetical protein [Chloroflexaceae bacterium]